MAMLLDLELWEPSTPEKEGKSEMQETIKIFTDRSLELQLKESKWLTDKNKFKIDTLTK